MNNATDETANPLQKLLTLFFGQTAKAAETLVRAVGLEPTRAKAQQILSLRRTLTNQRGVRKSAPFNRLCRSMGYALIANPFGEVLA